MFAASGFNFTFEFKPRGSRCAYNLDLKIVMFSLSNLLNLHEERKHSENDVKIYVTLLLLLFHIFTGH